MYIRPCGYWALSCYRNASWETETIEDMHVAETQIASKRMQRHKALLELPQIHGLVSCITAMTLLQKQVISSLDVFYY